MHTCLVCGSDTCIRFVCDSCVSEKSLKTTVIDDWTDNENVL